MKMSELMIWTWAIILCIVIPVAFIYLGTLLWEIDFSAFVLYCVLISILGFIAVAGQVEQ